MQSIRSQVIAITGQGAIALIFGLLALFLMWAPASAAPGDEPMG